MQADVSEPDGVTKLVKATLKRFDRLDFVTNNTGVGEIIGLEDLDAVRFERTLRIDLLSTFLLLLAANPHMRE